MLGRGEAVRVEVLPMRAGYTMPAYHSAGAAGLDLAACLDDGPIELAPGQITLAPCGFAIAIPNGFEAQVRPRSGLATRHGITLPNAPGTIDSDYRGEVCVPLINLGKQPFVIEHGMRIAQMIIAPVSHATLQVVSTLSETDRGSNGFGSTGLQVAVSSPTSTGADPR
ncbi:MAG: dUTP diphosphatase [Phycisphaerales bacterium]|nr:dUTP diphosphatase [Phycisphaerales bacterium]